jgi:hypothetical protein
LEANVHGSVSLSTILNRDTAGPANNPQQARQNQTHLAIK